MMKVKAFNIDWDTGREEVDLPSRVTVEVADGFDCENDLADILSAKYGWLVGGCSYTIIK